MARQDRYVKVNKNGGFNHTISDDCRVVFDLTTIGSARKWETFLEKFNLKSGYKRFKYHTGGTVTEKKRHYAYTWSNSRVGVRTNNNPLTGKYSEPENRQDEKGYASSITIEGQCRDVKRMRDWIVENAQRIKGRKHRRIRKAFNQQHEPKDRDGSTV